MKKRLISLIVAVVMLFSMLCPAAYADDGTVSFDTCSHEWETPIRSGYSYTIPNTDVSFGVKVEQCKKCKWYKHVASIIIAEYTYYSPFNVDENGLIPTELATVWANVWYKTFGKNATATKFTPGGGSTSGGGAGRKDLPGYADDKGTASVDYSGRLCIVVSPKFSSTDSSDTSLYSDSGSVENSNGLSSWSNHSVTYKSYLSGSNWNMPLVYVKYFFTAPVNGSYLAYKTDLYSCRNYLNQPLTVYSDEQSNSIVCGNKYFLYSYYVYYPYSAVSGGVGSTGTNVLSDIVVYLFPSQQQVIKQTTITINNNTWNGNIYTDNSTNLTYIYPQYTTINEKNETVTNISNTPIIYNNETKQYYTYDQTTKNYYYITYNAQPTPSPSPTSAPTEKPGGSISTPETGKPGGDTGDTTGILAVLVEIRDNMIQGFLDIKTAFVAGFADLSANFTLAIENLNLNITNIFNKKFPDQSTPETALPSPTPDVSPSPTPSTPETGKPSPSPSPSPTPDPDATPTPAPTNKPDSGDKTNNFWTIIFPNGGGSEDGKKSIFWALVSLILALIAFFANLAVGVGYLFPFLPDGVVMTINTCLIVIFLFTIIKFIMRSK